MRKMFLAAVLFGQVFMTSDLCARDEVLHGAVREIVRARDEIIRLEDYKRLMLAQGGLQRVAVRAIDEGIQQRRFFLELCGSPAAYGLPPFDG